MVITEPFFYLLIIRATVLVLLPVNKGLLALEGNRYDGEFPALIKLYVGCKSVFSRLLLTDYTHLILHSGASPVANGRGILLIFPKHQLLMTVLLYMP